ncbi:hypothetical protein ACH4VS_37995 [Streptomyces hygroscopicus]|uniref:hypothetical protein n=1 Tax=Streptomyces hygroscopicus TaxID=1912 RepID=UPI000830195F|nr:hypothetical protein [Streptomyces hygroscopicus]GLV79384.1 hypothetical protein Shyhy02_73840 [Streptomyces hygroscopicus subsp. hygroscopicus]
MLIYAFRDARGAWHGDPDAEIFDTHPGRGTLTLPPTAPGQEPGLFDGQRLEVLYAACDLEASQTSYHLDSGGSFLASWHVHELLSPAYRPHLPGHPAPAPSGTGNNRPTVKLETGSTNRRYSLSADLLEDGRVEVTVIVFTPDGTIQGELTGELDTCDLGEVGRLIASAPVASGPNAVTATPPATIKATRHGEAWNPQALDYLRDHYRAGKTTEQLAEELGRSEKSIRWKLWSLRIGPYPDDLAPAPRTPAEPEPPKAYTVEEKRQLHSNAYKRWTPDEDDELALRCSQGASLAELSQEFGRNEGAIVSRLIKIEAHGPAADEARIL